jgi:hypothetical protein
MSTSTSRTQADDLRLSQWSGGGRGAGIGSEGITAKTNDILNHGAHGDHGNQQSMLNRRKRRERAEPNVAAKQSSDLVWGFGVGNPERRAALDRFLNACGERNNVKCTKRTPASFNESDGHVIPMIGRSTSGRYDPPVVMFEFGIGLAKLRCAPLQRAHSWARSPGWLERHGNLVLRKSKIPRPCESRHGAMGDNGKSCAQKALDPAERSDRSPWSLRGTN